MYRGFVTLGILVSLTTACSETVTSAGGGTAPEADLFCTIPQNQIFGNAGQDAIPALTEPTFIGVGEPGTEYLLEDDRVIGFFNGSQALAIPLNIMWFHEIVNLEINGTLVSITHCPLTGSTLGFDREEVRGVEFGVSGLLFQNNLIMYDRVSPESLWPQMLRGARCGGRTGALLDMVHLVEMTWEGWQALHPDTRVVSAFTGYPRPYEIYPYGDYDDLDNAGVLYPLEVDTRRPPKERVLGIPVDVGGIALPFGVLDEKGPVSATHLQTNDQSIVVFWDRSVQGAAAYRTSLNGQELTFSESDGKIVDDQTGTVWQVDGRAIDGAFAGSHLDGFPDAFVAYWFAWPAFYPQIQLWPG